MARKLVSIRQVSGIRPITGAPNLEVAAVDGWTCAVRRGTFTPGDLALFFEIDSFLPIQPQFLPANNPIHHQQKKWQGQEGYHVYTQMVGKEVSQGVLLKLELFPDIERKVIILKEEYGQEKGSSIFMDQCFARELGVTKWELRPNQTATKLGRFPAFIAKTDLTRIQDKTNAYLLRKEKDGNTLWQESVKMDGSSMTAYLVRADSRWIKSLPGPRQSRDKDGTAGTGRFGVCSREWDLVRDVKDKFWKAALENRLQEKLAMVGGNVAIQGELVGSTINGNRHGYPKGKHEFFVYSMWDIDRQERLSPSVTEEYAASMGLKHVPVLGYVKLVDIASSNDDLLERAKGRHADGRKREGIVFKAVGDSRCFKVIANDYLLEHKE